MESMNEKSTKVGTKKDEQNSVGNSIGSYQRKVITEKIVSNLEAV